MEITKYHRSDSLDNRHLYRKVLESGKSKIKAEDLVSASSFANGCLLSVSSCGEWGEKEREREKEREDGRGEGKEGIEGKGKKGRGLGLLLKGTNPGVLAGSAGRACNF